MRQNIIHKEVSAEEVQQAFAGGFGPRQQPQGRTLVGNMETGAPPIITAQPVAVERDETRVLAKIKALAAAAGDDWYYRYPVKNNRTGQTDTIEGPSIKCANNVARIYGNCQVDLRALDEGEHWLFYARFVDLETGFSMTRAFQQRKGQTNIGGKDDGRKLDIAFQIGQSKAIRNVVCNALETFTNYAFEESKASLVAKIGQRMEPTRAKILDRLREMEIDLHRVEAVVGRAAKDWLAPDMARIIAEIKSVEDGMASASETWPIKEPPIDAKAEPAAPEPKPAAAPAQPEPQSGQQAAPEPPPVVVAGAGAAPSESEKAAAPAYTPPKLGWGGKPTTFHAALAAELPKCPTQDAVAALAEANKGNLAHLAKQAPDLHAAWEQARDERMEALRA